MEPLSVISLLLQLATVAPQIDKVFVRRRRTYNFTNTEIIEIYRAYNQPKKRNTFKRWDRGSISCWDKKIEWGYCKGW